MTEQERGSRIFGGRDQQASRLVHERWAHLRFSVVGQLLAAPPPKGELHAMIRALAAQPWRHPTTGEPVRFGFSTIERWDYRALRERRDPVGVLRRKVRGDAGQQIAMSDAVRQTVLAQAEELTLAVEHRAAPSIPPVTLELAQRGTALALEVIDSRSPVTPVPTSLDDRITTTLAKADQPLPFADLRSRCRVRAATLYERLAALAEGGRVVKADDGYRLTND